ncbi:hypothetical protein PQ469_12195 [Mucilaginibacter sp. KACC 22773]|uniref:hypothetical protein n=1 Tax=Mucilaginibacter sp. KACC 22773 TaxID=3025671 RepID=UPI002366357C|nr:hypothetical protein [Mucilaginibacter sp. KACC 22773]WDF80768.1 hypothetical protein PQ469_12195 [Mucilaginibacter sp. KACC 22773]
MKRQQQQYLASLSEKDREYRESLAPGDRALYDYFSSSPAMPKSPNGGFTPGHALGHELIVGDCTPELWEKIGHM